MSNRLIYRKDLAWPYNYARIEDAPAPSKYIVYENGVIFSTLQANVDSAHDDGATPVYRSYIIRDFSIRGEVNFYTRRSRNHYVSHVDVCCFYTVDSRNVSLSSVLIDEKVLPMYSRTNEILLFNRYKTKTRLWIGESQYVQGYTDVVCTHVEFNLRTKRNIVVNPNSYVYLFVIVYTDQAYEYGKENLIVHNVDVDVRYDAN